jgi:hypothetical protein
MEIKSTGKMIDSERVELPALIWRSTEIVRLHIGDEVIEIDPAVLRQLRIPGSGFKSIFPERFSSNQEPTGSTFRVSLAQLRRRGTVIKR